FLDAGQLDYTEFGVGGIAFQDLGEDDLPGAIALRGGSTLVGTPACCTRSRASMAFVGLDPNGGASATFAVKLPPRPRAGAPKGRPTVLGGPHPTTLVVGSAAEGTFVARYRPDGRPDPGFGKGGFALVPGLFVEGPAAVRDSSGRIVLVGWRRDVPDDEG